LVGKGRLHNNCAWTEEGLRGLQDSTGTETGPHSRGGKREGEDKDGLALKTRAERRE